MVRPPSPVKSVLIVEDSPSLVAMYRGYVEPLKVRIRVAETLEAARRAVAQEVPEAVLLDLKLPDGDGLTLLKELVASHPAVLTIVMTAYGSINAAVDAMREGAYDFVVKPFSQERLVTTLRNALETTALRKTVQTIQSREEGTDFAQMVGVSKPMQAVYRAIQAVAPTDASVMITGETGTGKELCADAIHQASRRSGKSFVVLNCAAIPRDLLESELFGHLRGAFTGATANRDGAATLADGGTLFLDELGEMEFALQSKLLRFIQTGTFQRVGSSRTERVDVRFIAATNRDPLIEIAQGRFREDLYYRLNVVPIHLPPLRERGDDILLIADDFLERFAQADGKTLTGFGQGARQRLREYHWPGNVRQLQNVVRNAVIFANGPLISAEDLPQTLMPLVRPMGSVAPMPSASHGRLPEERPGFALPEEATLSLMEAAAFSAPLSAPDGPSPDRNGSEGSVPPFPLQPMAEIERQMIDYALQLFDGNVTRVASALDISASSVYRKRSVK